MSKSKNKKRILSNKKKLSNQYENSRRTFSNSEEAVYEFSENPCTHISEYARKLSCPQTRDRQTDRQGETNIPPPPTLFAGGIKRIRPYRSIT